MKIFTLTSPIFHEGKPLVWGERGQITSLGMLLGSNISNLFFIRKIVSLGIQQAPQVDD